MNDEHLQQIHAELAQGDKRMFDITQEVTVIKLEQAEFRHLLKENTDATKKIESDLSEILDFFNSVQGAFKVLSWIGKLAKPVGAIVGLGASFAAFWAALKSGVTPK